MIHAPAGHALTFEVTNDGSAPHTFALDAAGNLLETPEIQPGESATLEVPALAPIPRRNRVLLTFRSG